MVQGTGTRFWKRNGESGRTGLIDRFIHIKILVSYQYFFATFISVVRIYNIVFEKTLLGSYNLCWFCICCSISCVFSVATWICCEFSVSTFVGCCEYPTYERYTWLYIMRIISLECGYMDHKTLKLYCLVSVHIYV